MNRYFQNIREKTGGMNTGQKIEYILTYYWYHILGLLVLIFLPVFLLVHFFFGKTEPEFTCVMINQSIDHQRDEKMEQEFSRASGIEDRYLDFDSDYNISYGDTILEGVNESSYEKFFFRWSCRELDAVIMPESFLEYCADLGGEFENIRDFETGTLKVYEYNKKAIGIKVGSTPLKRHLNEGREELVLAFPKDGKHRENCQKFLAFMLSVEEK